MVNDLVLVLNSGMVPIAVCTVKDAVLAIFRDIAVPIKEADGVLRSPSTSMQVPRIISHYRYHRIPRARPTINKRNIILRDDHTCVYCKKRFAAEDLTIDHVVPRSQGGPDTWENLVCACVRCNARKGGRTPAQARMEPNLRRGDIELLEEECFAGFEACLDDADEDEAEID